MNASNLSRKHKGNLQFLKKRVGTFLLLRGKEFRYIPTLSMWVHNTIICLQNMLEVSHYEKSRKHIRSSSIFTIVIAFACLLIEEPIRISTEFQFTLFNVFQIYYCCRKRPILYTCTALCRRYVHALVAQLHCDRTGV